MVSKIERLEKITSKTRKNNSKRLDPLRTTHFFFFHFIKFFFSNQTFSVISKYLCRFINLDFCNLVQNFYSILYKDRQKNKSLWVQGYRCKIGVSCILLQIGCQLAHMNQDLKLFLIWMRRLTQLNFAIYIPEIKKNNFSICILWSVYVAAAGDPPMQKDQISCISSPLI